MYFLFEKADESFIEIKSKMDAKCVTNV